MPLGKRKRRILLAVGIILAGLAVLWFSMPLWLPWISRPIAARNGLRFAKYERLSYRRFALMGVSFTNKNVMVHADHVDGLVPSVWLWRTLAGNRESAVVHVSGWQLETIPSEGSHGGYSIFTNVLITQAVLKELQRWLPVALVSNGTMRFQETIVSVPSFTWSNANISADVSLSIGAASGPARAGIFVTNIPEFSLRANLASGPPFEISLDSKALHIRSTVLVSETANGLNVQTTNSWWTNRIDLTAGFGRKGLLPERASVQSLDLSFPGELIRLKEFQNISGSVSASWNEGRFGVDLEARAKPAATQTNLPMVHLVLKADGDTNAATIQSADLSSPGLKAEVTQPTVLYFTAPFLREACSVKLAMDLTRQPWIPIEGKLEGEADFIPANGRFPTAQFRLSGSNVGNRDLKTTTATIVGSMDWPWLVLDQIQADFEDGSIVKAKGKFEVQKQTIAGAHLDFTGPLIRRWLPTAWSYGGLSLSGDAEGPLKSIVHRGHLEISNVTNAQFYPLQIKADWNGNQLNLGQAAVSVAASNSALSARFSGSLATAKAPQTTNLITLQLQNLLLAKRGAANLELEKPIQMSVAWSATNRWSIHSDELHLLGRDGDVQLQAAMDWPNSGAFQGSIRNLSSDLLADFINASVERFEVGKLEAAAGWTNGPAKFQIDLSARSFQLPGLTETDFTGPFKMEPVSIELKLTGDQNGLAISNLIANSGTSTVARAQGFLPLTVNPVEPTNFIHLDSTKPLQLSATSQPHAFFWDQLAEWTGVFLQDPNLSLGLSGTWTSPRGQIQLRAQRLKFREAPPATPSFENLEVSLQLDQDRAWLTNCQVLIQGQAVTLSGQLPLGESFWDDVKQKKSPNLDKASGHLQFTNAQLAAFVPLFPTLLSPQGELSLNVRLQPGGKLEGDLLVHQARTRPLSTLGPIREIEVKMKLLDRELRLDSAKATIGGAPVAATGQADLSGTDWLRGAVPPFQFTLRGTNVPLSRQPESIVRADLDLAISKTNQAAAVITGTARLRDSFYLSDVADLVPGRVSSPSRRPPYFSIEAMPLADWRLAVHVTGSRFMKVRSTLFNGQVSANLTLQGTLKDPMAIGDLKIDSGLVRFPFANLEVQQGFVNLTSADPYRPQLIVNAVSKRFGYEAKMEVSGPVDAPVIQFSSTPPLDSEQIVLMLTAGELPKSGLNLTPQQKAETVALFLGSDLLTKLGFGDHTEDRLTIRSGEQVSEQGTPTYNVEYKLSKRWALVGEYDRFNDFNAGLKWRIYSK